MRINFKNYKYICYHMLFVAIAHPLITQITLGLQYLAVMNYYCRGLYSWDQGVSVELNRVVEAQVKNVCFIQNIPRKCMYHR